MFHIPLCHSNGCETKVDHGIVLENGFHFETNFGGSPLFHIRRTPTMLRDRSLLNRFGFREYNRGVMLVVPNTQKWRQNVALRTRSLLHIYLEAMTAYIIEAWKFRWLSMGSPIINTKEKARKRNNTEIIQFLDITLTIQGGLNVGNHI